MSVRCAVYTRKSTEEGLEQDFNSLDAQREACEAYIRSQRGLGWKLISKRYDDGGISGGTLERPALKDLLADIEAGRVDLVVVYKVDRLTRSLSDFSRIIETFDAREVSFVSVTQQFNTANSMGRLTLNMLLSFAQFEREVTAERIRDKIAASKKKGMWMGGLVPLGYDVRDKKLVVNSDEAKVVRKIFDLYLNCRSVRKLKAEVDRMELRTKRRSCKGHETGGKPFSRGHLYCLLHNPLYIGEVSHKGERYAGQHDPIVDRNVWDATQALLSEQAPDRQSKTNVDRRCILTGLVFDETGDRLCPTYAKKDGRTHAYYVSKRLMHAGEDDDTGWRLPGQALEDAVVRAVRSLLEDEREWINLLDAQKPSANIYSAARSEVETLKADLETKTGADAQQAIQRVVAKVTLEQGYITVMFRPDVLVAHESQRKVKFGYQKRVAFNVRRRGVETKIVLGSLPQQERIYDQVLISAIKRSFKWWRLLTEEDFWSIKKLAELDGVDASDVTRFLPLAFLSPDIVEDILVGRQPVELTLERLKKMGPLPIDWSEQALALGFN